MNSVDDLDVGMVERKVVETGETMADKLGVLKAVRTAVVKVSK